MISTKLSNLLSVASIFETRALSFWKKGENDSFDDFYQAAINKHFFDSIRKLLSSSPTDEELMIWMEKNPILQDINGEWQLITNGKDLVLRKLAGNYNFDTGNHTYIYISKSSQPPTNVAVIKSSLLQKSGTIPNLWFYRGEEMINDPATQTTPTLAQNDKRPCHSNDTDFSSRGMANLCSF